MHFVRKHTFPELGQQPFLFSTWFNIPFIVTGMLCIHLTTPPTAWKKILYTHSIHIAIEKRVPSIDGLPKNVYKIIL